MFSTGMSSMAPIVFSGSSVIPGLTGASTGVSTLPQEPDRALPREIGTRIELHTRVHERKSIATLP